MVVAFDGDPGHHERLPQRQGSGALCQAPQPGVYQDAGSGDAQWALLLHLPLLV